MTIKFHGVNEEGLEVITVEDYSRPPLQFTFRPIKDDETLVYYFECVMNQFWMHVGKNMRLYYE